MPRRPTAVSSAAAWRRRHKANVFAACGVADFLQRRKRQFSYDPSPRMTIFRRFLVLAVLIFWQGGFVFYSAVAIPVGHRVLEPRRKQAVITNNVAYYINLAGMASVVPLLWDVFARDPSERRRWVRVALWFVVLATLLTQLYLYREMNAVFPEVMQGNDPPSFSLQHKAYLWVSTAQLAAAIGYLVCALFAWRAQDRADGRPANGP
jgi:Domain of unknown function (DUF4149)